MYGCAQHILLVPTEAVASERAACALFIHLPNLPDSMHACIQMRQVPRFAWNLLCSPEWPKTHSNLSVLVSVADIIGLLPTGLAFIFLNNQLLLIFFFFLILLFFFSFFCCQVIVVICWSSVEYLLLACVRKAFASVSNPLSPLIFLCIPG